MTGSFSSTNAATLRALMDLGAAPAPLSRRMTHCASQEERLGLFARHIQRCVLPRQLDFLCDGECVVSVVAQDGRLTHILGPATPRACGPGDGPDICRQIDAAFGTGTLHIRSTAPPPEIGPSTGLTAEDVLASTGLIFPEQSDLDPLEILAGQLEDALLGICRPGSLEAAAGGPLAMEAEVLLWIERKLSQAAPLLKRATTDDLLCFKAPGAKCTMLAIGAREGEAVAVLLESESPEVVAECWARLLRTPHPLS